MKYLIRMKPPIYRVNGDKEVVEPVDIEAVDDAAALLVLQRAVAEAIKNPVFSRKGKFDLWLHRVGEGPVESAVCIAHIALDVSALYAEVVKQHEHAQNLRFTEAWNTAATCVDAGAVFMHSGTWAWHKANELRLLGYAAKQRTRGL